jgi:dTDP-4-dehydrorhamnose reductase
MRVLVTGASGQLGTDVVRALGQAGETCIPVGRERADFGDPNAVRSLVVDEAPDAVVNCAAFHDVAGCEEAPELARAINSTAVEALASGCQAVGAKLMTVSTDYVFDGRRRGGYTERDDPNPLNAYGASKLEGEQRARAAHSDVFVVRTQSLFGHSQPSGKGRNFVELILELARDRDELKVDQFRMAPTSTTALADNMVALLATSHYGLYHMSCVGETTWFEFARRIVELAELDVRVVPVANDYYPTPFTRPESTYLDNEALRGVGLDQMPTWEDALVGYLSTRRAALAGRSSS